MSIDNYGPLLVFVNTDIGYDHISLFYFNQQVLLQSIIAW